jgi:hypothetical protein
MLVGIRNATSYRTTSFQSDKRKIDAGNVRYPW